MRLKKIEIQGFKSFADKTTIEIKEGTTAIVGPNGSGKSNISDAIRWVLGEQSVKNLRGTKMEDVIFSGTNRRKALGYAEVTITLDNQRRLIPLDYSEIEVTRRMFRSGESEYYLNRNICRLRDIRELFMDTGVGKDGYSIIGQGRIDEILSNRPEDRRSIFEEAAGIVKYKSKKEEAERKLEKTEGNILRIKDLIYEISKQLENLEIQANKANVFNKLFNRLKSLEINVFVKEIRKINKSIEEIAKEREEYDNKLTSVNKEKEEIEKEFYELKNAIEKIESTIEKYREYGQGYQNELEKFKNKLTITEEKHKYYIKDLERLNDEKIKLEFKIDNLNTTEDEYKNGISLGKKQFEDRKIEYEEKLVKFNELEHSIKEIENHIEDGKNYLIKLYNDTSDKKSELNGIVTFNENIDTRKAQLKKEIDNLKNEIEISKSKMDELENIAKKTEDEISHLRIKHDENKSIISATEKVLETADIEITNIRAKLQSMVSSLDLLKDMEKGYEGYYKGVKSALSIAKNNPKFKEGFVGIVADLMKVAPLYEKAIEISLGSNIQNIVTENEYYAKNIIEYLRDNRLGRITCLPLNIIKGQPIAINQKDKPMYKIVGLAHELIDYDIKYDNIFKYLLGRTIIIQDIDHGIKFTNKYKHIYRIVTLKGEILSPGGSMTGGSFGDSGVNIISRRGKIERISKEINRLQSELINKEDNKNQILIELKLSRDKLLERENSIKSKEYLAFDTKNQINNNLLELNRQKLLIENKEREINTLDEERLDFKKEYNSIKEQLAEYEKKTAEQNKTIELLLEKLKNKKLERDEEHKVITNIQIELNSISGKIKNLEININNIHTEYRNSAEELIVKSDTLNSIKKSISDIIDIKEQLNNQINKHVELIFKNNEQLNYYIENKNEIMNEFYQKQDKLMKFNNIIGEFNKVINSQELKLAKYSVQIENYHKKLKDDYELDYQEALKLETDINNNQETMAEIRKLKGEIKELGMVNLGSIEEYKSLKARLDFILKQQNDLVEAKENLKKVIKDMEIKMKSQFLESFNKINSNFKEIFKTLFNGGSAELILDNEEDILTSGIDINVQPPGKKLQSLTLLSGGEKSLTAVTLLFAILQLKPSPFCILDEIDAALDEANINRYTNYLRKSYKDTQFIIITHRKTTMEIADVLYGVTMEEDGISKLISVKLKDYEKVIAS